MATSKTGIKDEITVEMNVKGPADDRLKNHAKEVKAYDPGTNKVKGPAPRTEV